MPAQGYEQPVHCAATQPRYTGDLGNAQLGAIRGEGVEDRDGPVEGLNSLRAVFLHHGTPSRLMDSGTWLTIIWTPQVPLRGRVGV